MEFAGIFPEHRRRMGTEEGLKGGGVPAGTAESSVCTGLIDVVHTGEAHND